MGRSFLTRGRGNPRSWNSCSHGAGRTMSRTKARSSIKQVIAWACLGVQLYYVVVY